MRHSSVFVAVHQIDGTGFTRSSGGRVETI
jgi:hypothetical protein